MTEKIVKAYNYTDEAGKLLYQNCRLDRTENPEAPKCLPRRPDGKGGWIWDLKGVRRVLYRLPEFLKAPTQDFVFLCEGEPDTDRVWSLGLPATTSGSATSWRSEFAEYFRGRLVCVLPDHDLAGERYAETVAESLHGVASEVRIVRLPGLGDGQDVSDWLDSGGDVPKLLELIDETKHFEPDRVNVDQPDSEWELPALLEQFDLPVFPLEAFPRELSVLCMFCEAVAESFQVPVDLPAMLVLSLGGASLAKRIIVHVRGNHREPVILFTAVALPPGNRKSGVFRVVMEPLVQYERQEVERLTPMIEQNRNDRIILLESLKHSQKQAAKTTKAEDRKAHKERAAEIVSQLADLEVLTSPQYIGDDATPESVALLLSDNGGRFALLSPEGDVFDLMAGRYSGGGTPNFGVYLKGHAGDDIRVNRANRDFVPRYVHEPALSIGIAIQPEVLRGLTLKKGFRGRGLLGRFLYSLPQSLLGHRQINPCPLDSSTAAAYQQHILNALRLEPDVGDDGKPRPRVLTVADDALRELDRFAAHVEKRLGPSGDLASMGDWAGKLVGAVCRIAGIFHGLNHANSGSPGRKQIDGETMLGAIAIGEYLIPHAEAAFFEMGTDPAVDVARRVLSWVSSEQIREFSRREAFNAIRGSVQKVDEIEKPLEMLIVHGYIRDIPENRKGPGRKPSPKYRVNPLWLAQNAQNSQNCPVNLDSVYSAQFAQEVVI